MHKTVFLFPVSSANEEKTLFYLFPILSAPDLLCVTWHSNFKYDVIYNVSQILWRMKALLNQNQLLFVLYVDIKVISESI